MGWHVTVFEKDIDLRTRRESTRIFRTEPVGQISTANAIRKELEQEFRELRPNAQLMGNGSRALPTYYLEEVHPGLFRETHIYVAG
ncbi:hypothetical protein IU485_27890 [Nocardia cyriacigeorgica]|uniref:hypothetical protein n=1 Tax=Nocardia cyriacigeorgica TaxID=135487 RepID=UPI0018954B92|nr:hypothetical protein [Nocardia cyriacigeorgica]MBF6085200.1 hypothetical protein [Nocardia cyriacigeorgica]